MRVRLPGSSVTTSALGLGCAGLSAGWSRDSSVRLVHVAYDAGIRHFDVAPPYGMGSAEGVLGQGLEKRRHNVTIATKVGLARPQHAETVMLVRNLAAPVRRLAPQIARRIGASTYQGMRKRPKLTAAFIENSLAESLRLLRTDYVDLLLLHEATPEDLTEDVLKALERLRTQGIVRCLGTGTSYENTLSIRADHPHFFNAWQHSWSVLDADSREPSEFTITYGSIQQALAKVRTWLNGEPGRLRCMSETTGVDIAGEEELGCTLLGAAVAHNPTGITLVSSRQKKRVQANARLLVDPTFVRAGQQLMSAVTAGMEMAHL